MAMRRKKDLYSNTLDSNYYNKRSAKLRSLRPSTAKTSFRRYNNNNNTNTNKLSDYRMKRYPRPPSNQRYNNNNNNNYEDDNNNDDEYSRALKKQLHLLELENRLLKGGDRDDKPLDYMLSGVKGKFERSMDYHQNELKRIKSEKEQLEREKKMNEIDIKRQQDEMEHLRDELNELRHQYNQDKQKWVGKELSLEAQVANLKVALDKSTSQKEKFVSDMSREGVHNRQRIDELVENVRDSDLKYKSLKKRFDEQSKTIRNLEINIAEKDAEIPKTFRDAADNVKVLKSENDELKYEIKKLSINLKKQQAETTSVTQLCDDLTSEVQDLKEKNQELNEQIYTLEERWNLNEEQGQIWSSSLVDLRHERDALKRDADLANESNQRISEQLAQIKSRLLDSLTIVETQNHKIDMFRSRISELEAERDEALSSKLQFNRDLLLLNEEHQKILKEHEQYKKDAQQLRKQVDNLLLENNHLTSTLDVYKTIKDINFDDVQKTLEEQKRTAKRMADAMAVIQKTAVSPSHYHTTTPQKSSLNIMNNNNNNNKLMNPSTPIMMMPTISPQKPNDYHQALNNYSTYKNKNQSKDPLDAAIKIQTAYRGHLGRQEAKLWREQKQYEHSDFEFNISDNKMLPTRLSSTPSRRNRTLADTANSPRTNSAKKIQRVYRGHRGREEANLWREQKQYEGTNDFTISFDKDKADAAVKIQSQMRKYLARQELKLRKEQHQLLGSSNFTV